MFLHIHTSYTQSELCAADYPPSILTQKPSHPRPHTSCSSSNMIILIQKQILLGIKAELLHTIMLSPPITNQILDPNLPFAQLGSEKVKLTCGEETGYINF